MKAGLLALVLFSVAQGNKHHEEVDLLQIAGNDLAALNASTTIFPLAVIVGAGKLLSVGLAKGATLHGGVTAHNALTITGALADKLCDMVAEEMWKKAAVKTAEWPAGAVVPAAADIWYNEGKRANCEYSSWCHEEAEGYWVAENTDKAKEYLDGYGRWAYPNNQEPFRISQGYQTILFGIKPTSAGRNCWELVEACKESMALATNRATHAAHEAHEFAEQMEKATTYSELLQVSTELANIAAETYGVSVFGKYKETGEAFMEDWENVNSWGFSLISKGLKSVGYGIPCDNLMLQTAAVGGAKTLVAEQFEEQHEHQEHHHN